MGDGLFLMASVLTEAHNISGGNRAMPNPLACSPCDSSPHTTTEKKGLPLQIRPFEAPFDRRRVQQAISEGHARQISRRGMSERCCSDGTLGGGDCWCADKFPLSMLSEASPAVGRVRVCQCCHQSRVVERLSHIRPPQRSKIG